MALKTGYKVNGKEIILDDYDRYGNTDITNLCSTSLDGYYKIGGKNIKASYFREDTGQIKAELPGSDYYKITPSSETGFALYGTNTVGGYYDGQKSLFLEEYYGSGTDYTYVNIGFNGTQIGELSLDSSGVSYYMSKTFRTYEYAPRGIIKIWCMAVASGGGGNVATSRFHYATGGGGGATALLSIHLEPYDRLYVAIPQGVSYATNGQGLSITLYKSWQEGISGTDLLTGGWGERGKQGESENTAGGAGGVFTVNESAPQLKAYTLRQGGRGGGASSLEAAIGESQDTISALADYYPMCKSEKNSGGTYGSGTYGWLGGGGASAFPGGVGGSTNDNPGPGGGTSASGAGTGRSGPGAFWILYA